MVTEIGLVPLFPSTIQTMSRSVLFKHAVVKGTPLNTMHEGITSGHNSAGMQLFVSSNALF